MADHLIPAHAWVVVLRDDGTQSFIRASENSEIRAGKHRALGNQLVGFPYGSTFEFQEDETIEASETKKQALEDLNKKRFKKSKGEVGAIQYSRLIRVERAEAAPQGDEDGEEEEAEDMNDNRGFQAHPDNQKADSKAMIKSGMSGHEIVQALTANSVTFEMKNKYSKQKFITRITRKYIPRVTILRTTGRTIAEGLFLKHDAGGMHSDPMRSCRWVDAVPQLLAYGNIHSTSRALVLDGIGGLLSLCVLERLQGKRGKCIFVATCARELEGGGGRPFIELLNLPKATMVNSFVIMPSYCLEQDGSVVVPARKKLPEEEKRVKVSEEDKAERDLDKQVRDVNREAMCQMLDMKQGGEGADSLIIAAKQNPTEAIRALFPHLGLGKPFVVHSPTIEPLMECRAMLSHHRHAVLDLMVTETFCREYQNLENRIHPTMTGSASGGFILRGIKVGQLGDATASANLAVEEEEEGEPKATTEGEEEA
ncbi:hypothetical protein BASA81_006876 [Batrachochytrium salamandrivorans]|nr:hypothetical protein BASA81_006876 [Batrachochytrium salamandrivorans]